MRPRRTAGSSPAISRRFSAERAGQTGADRAAVLEPADSTSSHIDPACNRPSKAVSSTSHQKEKHRRTSPAGAWHQEGAWADQRADGSGPQAGQSYINFTVSCPELRRLRRVQAEIDFKFFTTAAALNKG